MIKGSSSSQPVQFISTQKKLDAAVQALSGVPSFAFDLEFDRDRYSYGFTLCLVQLATPEVCFVIDPLASVSLAPLFSLFADPAIQKIMHSGGEDLRLLHALGCFPHNLYDTDITARLLNYEQCSLAALLFDVMGLLLHKGEQKSNWLKRPLTEGQINYAANDVIYLHRLKEALEEKLAGRPAAALLQSEQAMLSTTKYLPEEKVWFLRKEDERSLSPYEQHVLNTLYVLRDQKARLLDKPAYQVMEEALLRPLATGELPPAALPDAKGMHPRLRNEAFVTEVAATLAAAHAAAAAQNLSRQTGQKPRLSPEQRAARDQGERDKEVVFAPIQQELAARFGQNAARFLLSNGGVSQIVTGRSRIGQLPEGRQQLLVEIAAALGLEASLRNYF